MVQGFYPTQDAFNCEVKEDGAQGRKGPSWSVPQNCAVLAGVASTSKYYNASKRNLKFPCHYLSDKKSGSVQMY